MEKFVMHCKLLVQENDTLGYTTYVFQNLDKDSTLDFYVMCTKCPNWEHRELEIGEQGYLQYIEILAGKDTWFDGQSMVYYNYSNLQFIKFISETAVREDNNIIID